MVRGGTEPMSTSARVPTGSPRSIVKLVGGFDGQVAEPERGVIVVSSPIVPEPSCRVGTLARPVAGCPLLQSCSTVRMLSCVDSGLRGALATSMIHRKELNPFGAITRGAQVPPCEELEYCHLPPSRRSSKTVENFFSGPEANSSIEYLPERARPSRTQRRWGNDSASLPRN